LKHALLIACCVVLHSCGNLVEHSSDRAWHQAGAPQAPSTNGKLVYSITPISPGHGDPIRAGDLVYAHVRSGTTWSTTDANVWLWTGDERADDGFTNLLDLGPAGLRAAFIGKQVGEHFRVEIQGMGLSCCASVAIPLFGFVPNDAERELSHYDGNRWPVAPLSSGQGPTPWGQFEILAKCPAHLLQRTALHEQWGPVLNMFDMHYPTSRSGTLVWGALQADCAPPHPPVRFEIGPLSSAINRQLLDWDASYAGYANLAGVSRPMTAGPLTGVIVFIAAFVITRRLQQGTVTRGKPRQP